jgi:hypothetical protein
LEVENRRQRIGRNSLRRNNRFSAAPDIHSYLRLGLLGQRYSHHFKNLPRSMIKRASAFPAMLQEAREGHRMGSGILWARSSALKARVLRSMRPSLRRMLLSGLDARKKPGQGGGGGPRDFKSRRSDQQNQIVSWSSSRSNRGCRGLVVRDCCPIYGAVRGSCFA